MRFSMAALLRTFVIGGAVIGLVLSHYFGESNKNPLLTDMIILIAVALYFAFVWRKLGPPPWFQAEDTR